MATASSSSYDAVILAGGRARRLGGLDKPGLVVGTSTLLEHVLAAVADAGRLIVVGPARPGLMPRALVVQEDPPGGGPVAAVAAGLAHVTAPEVAVLAADLPFLTSAALARLRAALGATVAMLVDGTGCDQPLCAVWRTAALRQALATVGNPERAPMRKVVVAGEPAVRVAMPDGDAHPPPWFDCDTPADLAAAREWSP